MIHTKTSTILILLLLFNVTCTLIGCKEGATVSKLKEQLEVEKNKREDESKKYVEVLNRLHEEMKRSEEKDKLITDLKNELESATSGKEAAVEGHDVQSPSAPSTQQVENSGEEILTTQDPSLQEGIDKLIQFANRFYWDGDYVVSKELYEIARGLGATDVDTTFRLARCYGVTPETDRAITLYKEVIASLEQNDVTNPLCHQAYNNLGGMYKKKGLYKEAELAYVRAIEINEEYTNAYYNLGLLYEEILDDELGAIRCYEKYIELNGDRSAYIQKKLDTIRERD